MADVKELKALVTKENEMFVKHFKTGSAPRNLMRGMSNGNGKEMEAIIDDGSTQAIMMVDAMIAAVTEGFKKYLEKKAEMDSKGDKVSMPDRVGMFRDMTLEEIKGMDDAQSSAIEDAITKAMKECDVVSSALGNNVDQNLVYQAILLSAIRGIMVAALPEEKKDDSDASGHKAEPPKADGTDGADDQSGSTGDDGEPAGTAGTNDSNNQQPNGSDVVVDNEKVEEVKGKFYKMVKDALTTDCKEIEKLNKAREEISKMVAGFDKVLIEELNRMSAPVDTNGTVAFANNLIRASIPATYIDELGSVKLEGAINLGVTTIVEGCSGCADTATSTQISSAVATGAFMMYSLLASQIDDTKNINWLLMIAGEELLTKEVDEATRKNMYKTLLALCQFDLLNQYKARVDVAIFKDTGNIADQHLADFGRNLCAAEVGRHIRRGIEICKAA